MKLTVDLKTLSALSQWRVPMHHTRLQPNFFINLADNDFLDHTATTNKGWGYAVFGTVTAGMDVVNAIAIAKTTSKYGHDDVPCETIIVEKVTIK